MQKNRKQKEQPPFIFWEYFKTLSFFLSKRKFLIFAIPLCGLLLSSLGFCTAFQRSGAVLVALAIYLAYYKQPILQSGDYYKKKFELTADMANTENVKKGLMRKMPEEKAEKFAKAAASSRQSYQANSELSDALRAEFYKAEALMGVGGTLIWGFGDFICWCKYPLNIFCIFQ